MHTTPSPDIVLRQSIIPALQKDTDRAAAEAKIEPLQHDSASWEYRTEITGEYGRVIQWDTYDEGFHGEIYAFLTHEEGIGSTVHKILFVSSESDGHVMEIPPIS